jgi:hypothetical protein
MCIIVYSFIAIITIATAMQYSHQLLEIICGRVLEGCAITILIINENLVYLLLI